MRILLQKNPGDELTKKSYKYASERFVLQDSLRSCELVEETRKPEEAKRCRFSHVSAGAVVVLVLVPEEDHPEELGR